MATTYFVDPVNGNDNFDGLTETTPWKTLQRVSSFRPNPRDSVRLHGGVIFEGQLDWSDWSVGDPNIGHILVSSYGIGIPTIQSPVDQCAINYSGAGGLVFENLRLVGQATNNQEIGGLMVSPKNGGCDSIEIRNVEASGFGGGGIYIQGGGVPNDYIRDILITNCKLHDNINGLWLSAVARVIVDNVLCQRNDWLGVPAGSHVFGGNGAVIGFANDVTIKNSDFNYNGLQTINAGGHTGLSVVASERIFVERCLARGNGDPTSMQDGQGFIFYGCKNSHLKLCVALDNINGLSLFEDSFTNTVENCDIMDCVATGNQSDLSLHGTILGGIISGNQFLSTIYKAMDIAVNDASTYRDNLRVFGNTFRIAGLENQLLFEAAQGLKGIELLEANVWDGPTDGRSLFSVYGRGFSKLRDALVAEPLEI